MDRSQIEVLVYYVPIGKKVDQSQNKFLMEEVRITRKLPYYMLVKIYDKYDWKK